MCGIQFNYQSKQVYDTQIAPVLVDAIRHRGPDEYIEHVEELKSDVYSDAVSVFGFHRLYVMNDSNTARQPISRGAWIVICNGEIYNHASLYTYFGCYATTSSDCEIIACILDKYHPNGIRDQYELAQTLRRLDGEYAFCAWNTNSQQLVMCRDLTGVRPLYYSKCDQDTPWISVASEQKGVYRCHTDTFAVDPTLLYTVTVYASSLELVCIHRWSTSWPLLDRALTYTDVWTALHDTVRQSLMGTGKKACFLSGGLDSSIIASLLVYYNADVDFFTIGLDHDSSDIKHAIQVADWLGVADRHHVYTFTVEEGCNMVERIIHTLETFDVTTIRASIPQYLLCQYIRRDYPDIKVLYSGEGSDELFQGYYYSYFAPDINTLQEDRSNLIRYLHRFDNLRIDRVTSAFGFEARVPFLHQPVLISAYTSVPSAGKQVLRAYPWNLPESVLNRPKHALSDAVSSTTTCWFRALKDYVEQTYGMSERSAYYDIYKSCGYNEVYAHGPEYWMPKWVDTDDPSATVLVGFNSNR